MEEFEKNQRTSRASLDALARSYHPATDYNGTSEKRGVERPEEE
jgi:hypothetical protein